MRFAKDAKSQPIFLDDIVRNTNEKIQPQPSFGYLRTALAAATFAYSALLHGYQPSYAQTRDDHINNMEHRVPLKVMHTASKSAMGGIFGYTYLGENFIVRRDDLIGDLAREVDIHECIHTSDEKETIYLTRWIMQKDGDYYLGKGKEKEDNHHAL